MGHHVQQNAYLMYQFFDQESHVTPYMTGSYLGTKKIANIAAGVIHQKNATWVKSAAGDTLFQNMTHWAIEGFLDMPLQSAKKTAINAYLGYFNTQYGSNYLRYNGIMNPANGTTLPVSQTINGQGPTYGNAYPMFGTGHVVYSQLGYLNNHWMPYANATWASYDRLHGLATSTYAAGINYYLQGNKAKLSLELQNRPTYEMRGADLQAGQRQNSLTMQFQLFI
jgi:hypothetical protein